jgi:hypothetical protein
MSIFPGTVANIRLKLTKDGSEKEPCGQNFQKLFKSIFVSKGTYLTCITQFSICFRTI